MVKLYVAKIKMVLNALGSEGLVANVGVYVEQTGRDHFFLLYHLRLDITVLSQTALLEKKILLEWISVTSVFL